jgi:hypothetical protein
MARKHRYKAISILLIVTFLLSSIPVCLGSTFTIENNKVIIEEKKIDEEVDFWALIVASDPLDDSVGEWNLDETTNLVKVLLEGGWNEDHIKFLQGPVTKYEIYNGIEWLVKNSDSSDTVLVGLFDHGWMGNFFVSDIFNSSSLLNYRSLDRKLDRVKCAGMGIIIDACRSGTAIPWLKQDKRVIITSCDVDEHSGFVGLSNGLEDFVDYKEDIGNYNGATSIEELFEYYTKVRRTYPDYPYGHHPRISDRYADQLHLTFQNWSDGIVDQFQKYSIPSNSWFIIRNDSYYITQSFIPSTDILTKIKILAKVGKNNIYPITLTVRKTLSGENLTSSTIIPNQYSDYGSKYLTFDFPDINVDAGETYYILITTKMLEDDQEYDKLFRILCTEEESYDKGNCFISIDGGDTWEEDEYTSDIFFVTYGKDIEQNQKPCIPKRPVGPIMGKRKNEYTYYVSTTDIDDDQIYYKIDWGDGNFSEWIGPYDSEEIVEVTYNWSKRGDYLVKVRARDENDQYTQWSDGLKVYISKSRFYIKLQDFLYNFKTSHWQPLDYFEKLLEKLQK